MTTHRRKKVVRQRGYKTHGWGSMKKHRGAGNRGGRGMAGTGKRAGHKVQQMWKKYGERYLGRKGFKIQYKKNIEKGINLNIIERKLSSLIEKGFAKKEGDKVFVDLDRLGYNKLLGTGDVNTKMQVKVKSFSKRAKEKLEKAGGELVSG